MMLKEKIIKILKENFRLKDSIIKEIEKYGLFNTLKLTTMTYTKLWSIVGDEYLNRKIKQEFIQTFFKELGYGFSLGEIDKEPIFYGENESTYKEIVYLGPSKVAVIVWDKDIWQADNEFGVIYHNLSDNIIDEIFDIVTELYDNNRYIKK